MDDRRSGRTRKAVDYAKFCGGKDIESDDDDFREKTAPPSKRKKEKDALSTSPRVASTKVKNLSQETNKNNKSLKESIKENEDSVPKPRKSVNDKVFERQLTTALENSKNDSETLSSNCIDEGGTNSELQSSSDKENSSSDDSIAEKNDNKKEEYVLDEDVSSAESETEEEERSDWSDDSDGGKKSKKGRKSSKKNVSKKEVKKPVGTSKTKSQLPAAEKCKKPPAKSSITQSRSVPKTNMIPKSPLQVISSPLRLPSTGLRLGLSRKIPGKPLHSVVKVQL